MMDKLLFRYMELTPSVDVAERRWRELMDPTFIEGIIYNPQWPYRCCNKEMTIEEDTSAQCYSCGRYISNAVPCATREQCLSNSRIRKPYNRIKYFREWMRHILGYNSCFLTDDQWQKIKNKNALIPQDVQRILRELGLKSKDTSYILSQVTGKPIPEVTYHKMSLAEDMFMSYSVIRYYPDVIYEIFYKINPQHPILLWIPARISSICALRS